MKAHRSCRALINQELKFHRALDWQLHWIRTFQNLIYVGGGATSVLAVHHPIAHEAPCFGVLSAHTVVGSLFRSASAAISNRMALNAPSSKTIRAWTLASLINEKTDETSARPARSKIVAESDNDAAVSLAALLSQA